MLHHLDRDLIIDQMQIFSLTLDDGDDRVAAIMGTAHLEDMLRTALKSSLPGADAALRKKLLDGMGPLSSFSARAHMARALGILDEMHHHDLLIVGKVRNQFAHQVRVDTFAHEKIVGQIDKLKLPAWKASLGADLPQTPRYKFTASALTISQMLSIHIMRVAAEAAKGASASP